MELYDQMWKCGRVAVVQLCDGYRFHNLTIEKYKNGCSWRKNIPKNIYANPFDFWICPFTALGCFFALQDLHWIDKEKSVYLLVLAQMKDLCRRGIVKE